jgi:ergothioneine biosynthesis protein EgtB
MADHATTAEDRTLAGRFLSTRSLTEELAAPLSAEDQTVQSMPDVSPTKWHRAHTSWFFETFLLAPSTPSYREFHPAFSALFNSYYQAVGSPFPRGERGLVSRPGIHEIGCYRAHVDRGMLALLDGAVDGPTASLVELGIHHEQQHQELLLMDIKHVLSRNPLQPAYSCVDVSPASDPVPTGWSKYPGGSYRIGHAGQSFGFDNEFPRHEVHLEPFAIADAPVTCAEWLAFISDDGYRRPELWLSDGWAAVQAEGWESPLYWSCEDGAWEEFTLGGPRPLNPAEPVCHISYYEADAFSRWAGCRLPTEAEWEVASADRPVIGHFLDLDVLHPSPVTDPMPSPFGDVWQWTSSAYSPYPGFTVSPGAVGEYNGKFMVSQYVLRGGCCATPTDHIRATYRNFFPPSARWAFSGLRMARDS